MASFLKKALANSKAKAGPAKRGPEKWLEGLPALQEFLTSTVGPDGQARTPSSLALSSDDRAYKGCLRELDAGLMLWATASTLWGVLEALDGELQGEAPDWRVDKYSKSKPRGK